MANIYDLEVGSALAIEGADYTITGALELEQSGYRWKEYNLKGVHNEVGWLSAEKWAGPDRYMLTWPLEESFFPTYSFIYNELRYKVFDAGYATVVGVAGDEDAKVGEQVFFKEYLYEMPKIGVEKEQDILLTYELWGKEEAFSGGCYLTQSQIVAEGLDFKSLEDSERFLDLGQSLKNLPLGTFLNIKQDSYYVVSAVENKQKNYIWWEYELKRENGSGPKLWLTVEPYDQLNLELSVGINYSGISFKEKREMAEYNGREYELVEQGSAYVKSFTHGDYDQNEPFDFLEYIHKASGKKLSIESWEDENEASIGTPLSISEISIDHTKEKKKILNQFTIQKPKFELIIGLIILGVFFQFFFSSQIFGNKIQSRIKSHNEFLFLSSVTLNDKYKTKAEVYWYIPRGIVPTIDGLTKTIISMDPERVQKVYSSTEAGEEVLIITDREQALIYYGESDEDVFVQVSKLDKHPELSTPPFLAGNITRTSSFYRYSGTRYRGTTYLDLGDNIGVSDSNYGGYITSARNSSIASRQSSGGGTGFGK